MIIQKSFQYADLVLKKYFFIITINDESSWAAFQDFW